MSDQIRAIETSYKGCKFRSRVEARWAIFFDACGIKWDYEKDGYDLGENGLYLPDFWLPDAKTFAEVKGQEFTVREINLCRRLAVKSGHPVIMLAGTPEQQGYRVEMPNGLLEERGFLPNSPDVVESAVLQARSARFEHGETPDNVMPRPYIQTRQRRYERREQHSERGDSAERELIRAILLNRSRVEQIAEKLGDQSLRDPHYRAIYRALLAAGPDASMDEIAGSLEAGAVVVVEDLLAEGAIIMDPERTMADSLATLRARDLDKRAEELDRIIPLADGEAKDKLIEEKDEIRKELLASGRNYYAKFRRQGR